VAERLTIREAVLALGFVDRGELTTDQLDKALDVLAMTKAPQSDAPDLAGSAR
jgi:fumarate hydratase class II